MRRRLIFVLCLFVGLSLLVHLRFNRVEVKAPNDYPVHNLDTSLNYTSIQAAINAPETLDGHTIRVDAGTYFEHLTITKSISLVGEDKDATIVDGNGTGTVILICVGNVSVIDFTIRNAGRMWGPPPGYGYPDSCLLGSDVKYVKIENNAFINAAVCVAFADHSSLVNISNNIVYNATYIGILAYASHNFTICRNHVFDYGSEGIHLDGGSDYCKILNNTVKNGFDGISLETDINSGYVTANNLIDGNYLVNNTLASIALWRCGTNVFRRNNITSSQHNLLIWGCNLSNFMQDIDDSNTANNKILYYLANRSNLVIEPSNYPDLGYIALVNCANVVVRDFDLTSNRDGVLMACSTGCTLINITLGDNQGPLIYGGFPLIYGGLTFFESNNNTITNSRIHNNSYGVCLYRSDSNVFYRNSFSHNDKQVVSDFLSPFQNISSEYFSSNIWDNGFEGNYWSDYTGEDQNGDGIGDTPYVIDEDNQDNHPLMAPWITAEEVPPFWMQWWFWSIVATGIVVLAGAVYFLNKRRSSTPTTSSLPYAHKDNNTQKITLR